MVWPGRESAALAALDCFSSTLMPANETPTHQGDLMMELAI